MMIRPTGSKFNHIYIEPDEELPYYFQYKNNKNRGAVVTAL